METGNPTPLLPLLTIAVAAVIIYGIISLLERSREQRLERFVPALLVLIPAVLLQFTAFAVAQKLLAPQAYLGAMVLYFFVPLAMLRLFFHRSWARSSAYSAAIVLSVLGVHLVLGYLL